MKNYDKNKELLNPKYWNVTNLHKFELALSGLITKI